MSSSNGDSGDTEGGSADLTAVTTSILPNSGSTYDIGEDAKRFSTIYADTLQVTNLLADNMETTDKILHLGEGSVDDTRRGIMMEYRHAGPTIKYAGIIKSADDTFHFVKDYTVPIDEATNLTDPSNEAKIQCKDIDVTDTARLLNIRPNGALLTMGSSLAWSDSFKVKGDLDIQMPASTANAFTIREIDNATPMFSFDTTSGVVMLNGTENHIGGRTDIKLPDSDVIAYTIDNAAGTKTYMGINTQANTQSIGNADSTTTINNDLVVLGNLSSNTHTSDIRVDDGIIELLYNIVPNTATDTNNSGIVTQYGDSGAAYWDGLIRSKDDTDFHLLTRMTTSPTQLEDVTGKTHADLNINQLKAASVVLDSALSGNNISIYGVPTASYNMYLPTAAATGNSLIQYTPSGIGSFVVNQIETVSNGGPTLSAWAKADSAPAITAAAHSITWSDTYSKFYCLTNHASNLWWQSSDGKNWSSISVTSGNYSHIFAYGSVIMSSHITANHIKISNNGTSITSTATIAGSMNHRAIGCSGTAWIVCCQTTTGYPAMIRSVDSGANWTITDTDSVGWNISNGGYSGILYSSVGSCWFAVGNAGGTLNKFFKSSDDGATWNSVAILPGISVSANIQSVFESNSTIIVVTGDAAHRIYRSTDGITFTDATTIPTPSSGSLWTGCYENGSGLFLLTTSDTTGEYLSSDDEGKNWVLQTDMLTGYSERTIAHSESLGITVNGHISGGNSSSHLPWRTSSNVHDAIKLTTHDTLLGASNNTSGIDFKANSVATTAPFEPPTYTDTTRDALTAVTGSIIWNSDTSTHQIYDGSLWNNLMTQPVTGGWEDLIAKFSAGIKNTTFPPTEAINTSGFTVFEFGVNDIVGVEFHTTHDYKLGSDAFIHIHWYPKTAMTATHTVVWEVSYVVARGHQQGESLLATPTVLTLTHTADGTEVAGEHMITESATGFDLLEPDAIVMVKIERVTGVGFDATPVIGLQCDLHYQSAPYDGTLNKAPNFYA